jgi:vitamin B12 transporter
MTLRNYFLLLLLLLCQSILGQNDTIVLQEVVISDSFLQKYSTTKTVTTLNDSIIRKSASSLTSLLNFNTPIYFKENGLGMVSSPSFRGTTAQQTAVIWNGININSQLNGQTDFNTLNSSTFNSITVRAGGGSSIYGSSAIGGTIHLNNQIDFNKTFSNQLQLRYGSFNTMNANYSVNAATQKISTQFSLSHNRSDNDYEYLDTQLKNENGAFKTTSAAFNLGYKINSNSSLKLYSHFFEGERHFSGTLAAPSKSKYDDVTTRNLLEFSSAYKKTISTVRLAFLTESYQYFEDKDQSEYSFGKSETALFKYDLAYKVTPKITGNVVLDYNHTKGSGSDVSRNSRQIASGVVLMKHQVSNWFLYEVNLRKEITAAYESPILYALGTQFLPSKMYTVKFNFSKNFRIPTFNDLYWTQGGNENLRPESAYQFDVIQELKLKRVQLSVTGFYNKISDLINWKPNDTGLWQPINTDKVQTYGVELGMHSDLKMATHHQLQFNATYGYTISENELTQKQLIYVPYHKLTSNLAYHYKKITFFMNYMFNGAVFTSLDNSYKLKKYTVVNSGLEHQLFTWATLGFQVNNLFNENYQIVAQRPFPGRNYTVTVNFNL